MTTQDTNGGRDDDGLCAESTVAEIAALIRRTQCALSDSGEMPQAKIEQAHVAISPAGDCVLVFTRVNWTIEAEADHPARRALSLDPCFEATS